MRIDVIPLLSFVLITTFTPGPNTISSASMAVLHGYRTTLGYLLGIAVGFFGVMLLCAAASTMLAHILPRFATAFHLVGGGYVLWLAWKTWHSSYSFPSDDPDPRVLGFGRGLLVQILNPKVVIYGLTLYSTFLASLTGRPLPLLLSAFCLAMVAFSAISTWALFGVALRSALQRPRIRQGVNLILSLLLVYTAIELSGLPLIVGRLIQGWA